MEFRWTAPKKAENSNSPHIWWKEPVIWWLRYNDIWFDNNPDHFKLSYNDFHHFFDLTIYEHRKTMPNRPRSPIEKMREYLKASKLKWKEDVSWRWDEDGTNRAGVQFTIKAEEASQ